MKKIAVFLLSLLLLISVTLPYNTIVGNASSNDEEYVIKSSVIFTAFSKIWNFTEEEKAINLYMNTSWQTVNLINSSSTLESVKTDGDRNSIAILNMTNITAGTSTEYTVFYQILSTPRNLPNIDESTAYNLSEIPHNLTDPYLSNSGTWMTNNIELQHLAENLAGNETNVLVIVENFVNWIWKTVDYPRGNPKVSHEVPLYPNETLFYKEGDCDDQAILLISLCRIIGIPAYLQIGCINDSTISTSANPAWNGTVENTQIHIAWHGWAMVYIPPWDWLPVDLTYSSRGNPLNAIKTAAVADQNTIQYMNIIKTDYAIEARQYRIFLANNNFKIQTYDEIIPEHGTDPFVIIPESLIQYVLIVLLFVGVITSSAVVLLYVKRTKKNTNREPMTSSNPLLSKCKPL